MKQKLNERLHELRLGLVHWSHKLHRAHAPVHVAYFGLVAWEAGKLYAMAAGVLAVLTILAMLSGED